MASADNDNAPKGSHPASETTGAKCPICGKPAIRAVRPFCSARCANIDLGRWMAGSYLIVGGQSDADEDGDDAAAVDAGRKRPEGNQEPDV